MIDNNSGMDSAATLQLQAQMSAMSSPPPRPVPPMAGQQGARPAVNGAPPPPPAMRPNIPPSMQQGGMGQSAGHQMPGMGQPMSGMPPTPPTQQRPSGQDAMRARMQASRNQQTSAQAMTQGEQYAPQPTVQQAPPPQQQQGSPVANRTIINTTQSPDNQQDSHGEGGGNNNGGKKGFKMNPIMAIGIVIAILLFVFFAYSYASKQAGESGEQDPTTDTNYDPFADPNMEWVVPENQYTYTPEETAALRAAGYTGDEIEAAAAAMTPAGDLIKEAEAARDAYIQQAIAPLYDTASDEYKHFISQTWLALRERHDIETWGTTAMQYSERKNLDYEKIDTYGNQLYVKIYLDDFDHKDWFYCLVTPDEWKKLNDAGNIIVNYTYTTQYIGDDPLTSYEDMENYYIIDARIEFIE